MKNVTYIVIDESGALHQQENDYFVIAGYITKQIYSIKSSHKKAEKELRKEYPILKKYTELKGSYLRGYQKAELLNKILIVPTTIPIAIIIDKKHILKRENHDENIKYNYFLQVLLSYLLHNFQELLNTDEVQLILDNRNVSIGSLNSLQDYLNSALELIYNKKFKVVYRNSNEHREVQVADLISNVLFSYYNYRSDNSTYYSIPNLKNTIISKFPYKKFEEPQNIPTANDTAVKNEEKIDSLSSKNDVDNLQTVWYIICTRPRTVG